MRARGYLTAVDLINDISKMPSEINLPNNEYIKSELFGRYLGEEGAQIDKDVMVQFKDAVRKLDGRIDAAFYGLDALFKPTEKVKEALQEEEPSVE